MLCDIRMPVLDGLGLLAAMTADPVFQARDRPRPVVFAIRSGLTR